MFNVTVNGRFLARTQTGVERFALELLRAWLPVQESNTVRIAVPANMTSRDEHGLGVPFEQARSLKGHAWEQFELPAVCGDDVLLSLCNTSPVLRRRQAVVVHDASFAAIPSNYSFAYRSWHRFLCASLMRRAEVVVTVSNFSADELATRIGGRRGPRIEVIYEGSEHVLRADSDRRVFERVGLTDRPYVLAVGSLKASKNLRAVAQAAALLSDLDLQFVAAGGSNSRVFAGAGLPTSSLTQVGYVSDGELRALYENAVCFVFPSLYEGFGLPPLEAMHCGCPVIVSRCSSLPEICGAAALYCDPNDPADLAAQIRVLAQSPGLRAELREAGLARVRHFTWKQSANSLNELMRQHFGATA